MRVLPIAILGLLVAITAGTASAVELRDAERVASSSPVLQNGSGTLQLEDSRLGRLGPPVFVHEPGALWQLGSGIGLLELLAGRSRRRTASQRDTGAPGPDDSATRETQDHVVNNHLRYLPPRAPWLAILALTLLTAPAFARCPRT